MKRYVPDAAGLTDQGVKRDHNEDAWSAPATDLTAGQLAEKGLLYVVADGVGGHQAGDVASAMAADIIQRSYYEAPPGDVVPDLTAAIRVAHEAIALEAAAKSERYGMGSTVTAVVVHGTELTVANVGDSRTYLIRGGKAHQLTIDHTWVEEQVQIGLITREEAARHPQRNIITRSLGGNQALQIDIFEEHLAPGDNVLLCSDGLSNMVRDSELGTIVSQGKNTTAVARKLVELAKERGAPDNVTAVVINLEQARRRSWRLLAVAGMLGALFLVVGIVALLTLDPAADGARPAVPVPTLETTTPGVTPAPTLAPAVSPSPPVTPTMTPLPLDTAIPSPQLSQPNEDTPLAAGLPIRFTWEWDSELDGTGWQFVFTVHSEQSSDPLVREELPLNQRGYGLAQALQAGQYWWTLTVVGPNRQGETAEKRFTVAEPTPTP